MAGKTDIEIISLIKDLQKQINYLEKKIDILVNKSAEGASKGRNYSRTSSNYGGTKRPQDKRENRFGAKNMRSGHADEGRSYPKKRIPFSPSVKKDPDKPQRKKVVGSLKRKK